MTVRLCGGPLSQVGLEAHYPLLKQTLSWASPRLRHPAQADRWTWLVLASYTSGPPGMPGQKRTLSQ